MKHLTCWSYAHAPFDYSVKLHCSVTIIVAYLMKKHHMSLSQALDIVRSKRPQAAPNYGFMLRLQKFEKSLRGN